MTSRLYLILSKIANMCGCFTSIDASSSYLTTNNITYVPSNYEINEYIKDKV
jgi:hypothetical protein